MPDLEIRQLTKDDFAVFKAIRLEVLRMEPAAYASSVGEGLAEGLMDAVAKFAAESGVLQIELNVSSQNSRAVRFYERSGFRAIGLIPAGMIHEGEEVDEVIMARRLM